MFYICSRVYELQDDGVEMPDSFAKCVIPHHLKGTSKKRTAAAKGNVKTETEVATENVDESSGSESENESVEHSLPRNASKRSPTAKHLIVEGEASSDDEYVKFHVSKNSGVNSPNKKRKHRASTSQVFLDSNSTSHLEVKRQKVEVPDYKEILPPVTMNPTSTDFIYNVIGKFRQGTDPETIKWFCQQYNEHKIPLDIITTQPAFFGALKMHTTGMSMHQKYIDALKGSKLLI